jgi:hypothetical protein
MFAQAMSKTKKTEALRIAVYVRLCGSGNSVPRLVALMLQPRNVSGYSASSSAAICAISCFT